VRVKVLAALAVAAVVLLALALTQPTTTQPAKQLDFELVDIYGRTFKLSEHRGKVVVLDFMATWCSPCSAQVEELKELREKVDVVIVSISVDPAHDTVERLRAYAESMGIDWTVTRDTVGLAARFKVAAIPTLVVLTPKGEVHYLHVGLISSEELEVKVREAMGT